MEHWLDLQGILKVADLYTKRNLWALGAYAERLMSTTNVTTPLGILLSGASLSCSRMLTEANRQITKGSYYIPQISRAISLVNAHRLPGQSAQKGTATRFGRFKLPQWQLWFSRKGACPHISIRAPWISCLSTLPMWTRSSTAS